MLSKSAAYNSGLVPLNDGLSDGVVDYDFGLLLGYFGVPVFGLLGFQGPCLLFAGSCPRQEPKLWLGGFLLSWQPGFFHIGI